MGTGELRMIHSRVVWMLRPVERSITVSAPQRIAHTILSTSSSTEDVTAELPILALILVRKFRPIAIGSNSAWLMLQGMMARQRRLARGSVKHDLAHRHAQVGRGVGPGVDLARGRQRTGRDLRGLELGAGDMLVHWRTPIAKAYDAAAAEPAGCADDGAERIE